jgi:hypothetical protein
MIKFQKTLYLCGFCLIICLFYGFKVPKGWQKIGKDQACFEVLITKGEANEGDSIASIKSICGKKLIKGYLSQTCDASNYLGKRVKMSANIKTKDVKWWAGMWLNVLGNFSTKSLGFDDFHDRPLKGTTAWTKIEIVVDVPLSATYLYYGFSLSGRGQIWIDKINMEIVDKSVPLTGAYINQNYPTAPSNLDFSIKE